MKKSILLLLLTIAFVGCKPKQSVTSTKLDNKSEVLLKGNWTISSVTFPGSDYMKVTSFDMADSNCFVGSTWKFVSNNNKGTMTMTKCIDYTSDITWYINKEGNLVLKYLNDSKSKKVLEGYILKVSNQTENSFELSNKVQVGRQSVDVIYHFERAI